MCLCLHETLYHDICWQGNTEGHKESREFVESIDDSFLTQVINDWTRVGPLLNMISTNKKELVGDGKVREIAALLMRCWSSGSREKGTRQKVGSQLWTSAEQILSYLETCLEDSHRRQPWGGVQESLLFFKEHIQAQEWLTPMTKI